MSLPVIVAAEAVGTVCLTGRPEEVHRFGLVVRRQTELLLEEAALLRSRLLHERAVDDFIRDVARCTILRCWTRTRWMGGRPSWTDPGTGADGRRTRRAPGRRGQDGPAPVFRMSLLRTVREFFSGSQDLAGQILAGRYAVLHASATQPGGFIGRCKLLAELIGERHGLDIWIAVGPEGTGMAGTRPRPSGSGPR
jgi:carbohydrate diacid regulator